MEPDKSQRGLDCSLVIRHPADMNLVGIESAEGVIEPPFHDNESGLSGPILMTLPSPAQITTCTALSGTALVMSRDK